jgi:hypothetical protein
MGRWLSSSEENPGSGTKRPSFRRIRWLAVLLPTFSIGLFEFLRHQLLEPVLPEWLSDGWLGNVAGVLKTYAISNRLAPSPFSKIPSRRRKLSGG